jgi:CO dehydrogenase/acetyl-CoA synthase beta subunit
VAQFAVVDFLFRHYQKLFLRRTLNIPKEEKKEEEEEEEEEEKEEEEEEEEEEEATNRIMIFKVTFFALIYTARNLMLSIIYSNNIIS